METFSSIPNSNFGMSGFGDVLPLQENRVVDFAVECYQLKYDLTRKNNTISLLKKEVKELKVALRKMSETNCDLRKTETVNELDTTKLQQELLDARTEVEVQKRNNTFSNRACAKAKNLVINLESKLQKYDIDMKDAELQM